MKILITGSESFIGKALIKQCEKEGISVIGIDLIDNNNADYEYRKCDVCSSELAEIIPEDVDAVIHLAALSKDSDCRDRAYECFNVNVMGTLNLMNIIKLKRIKQFVFASSEWVYDEFRNDEEKDENSLINIFNHKSEYALSKLVSESNLRQQHFRDDLDITILRFGIIYGPRKNGWSAVEEISNKIKNEKEIVVGSLKTGRRFVHVNDIVRGIILSLGLTGLHTINLTGDRVITLEDIIRISESLFNKKSIIKEENPKNISIRDPSNRKAQEMINWKPLISLEEGIKTLDKMI
jgi:nucleoside-diphosphate-sugar epimerase